MIIIICHAIEEGVCRACSFRKKKEWNNHVVESMEEKRKALCVFIVTYSRLSVRAFLLQRVARTSYRARINNSENERNERKKREAFT